MSNKLKLIIFDMDGVIVDSEPLHEYARQQMFKDYNIVPTVDFPEPVGNSSSGFWSAVCELCKLDMCGEELEREQYRHVAEQIEARNLGPQEGVMDILHWAKANDCKIGLASSSSRTLVDATLRLLKITDFFEFTKAGNEVEHKKPAPDLYLSVLDQAGVAAEAAIAIEDSSSGVKAAQVAGIFCYGYLAPTAEGQDLSQADCLVSNLSEIVAKISEF